MIGLPLLRLISTFTSNKTIVKAVMNSIAGNPC